MKCKCKICDEQISYKGFHFGSKLCKKCVIKPTKYRYDIDKFKIIDTPEKAYWLGFIYADGNCFYGKTTKQLGLYSKDKEILEKFRLFLNGNMPIKIDKRLKIRYLINICSKTIVSDLIKLGVMPNKRYKLKFPSWLNDKLLKHFIRGFFDGDGWISIQYLKSGHSKAIFGICNANYPFIKKFRAKLYKELELNKVKIYYSKSHTYSISYGIKKKLKRIYNYLYKNNYPYLERKKRKFEEGLKCLT